MQGKDLSVAPADLVPAQRSLTARPSAQPAPDFLDAEYADVRLTNLRDYLRVVYKRRRLAAICFGVTVGLAVLYTVLVPRKYSASARLQVPRRPPIQLQLKDNVLNLEETDRVVAGASSFLETQVAALQSRDLADRVIRFGVRRVARMVRDQERFARIRPRLAMMSVAKVSVRASNSPCAPSTR